MQHQDNSGLPRNYIRLDERLLWYESCLGAISNGLFSSFLGYLFPVQGVTTPALSLAFCQPGPGMERH